MFTMSPVKVVVSNYTFPTAPSSGSSFAENNQGNGPDQQDQEEQEDHPVVLDPVAHGAHCQGNALWFNRWMGPKPKSFILAIFS